MSTTRLLSFLVLFASLSNSGPTIGLGNPAPDDSLSSRERRDRAERDFRDRNYKDALEGFRKLALDPANRSPELVRDVSMAITCLNQLNQQDQIDSFREATIAAHKDDWRLLAAVAQSYLTGEHHGFLIAGKFQRGGHRGGGEVVNTWQRDRVRALQLMVQAMPLAEKDDARAEVGQFFQDVARVLLESQGSENAWRLQSLTDLTTLPDHEPGWGGYWPQPVGAPVDAQGNPVYFHAARTFQTAKNDGERWRWCLAQAIEMYPACRHRVQLTLADFFQSQYGVQTMAQGGFRWRFGRDDEDDDVRKDESGTFALHTLKDDETIARLASGVKRFTLPDEFNFISIYRDVAREQETNGRERESQWVPACERLAQVFENRRQYPKAAEYWRKIVDHSGPATAHLAQIVDPWGRFEPVMNQPAGEKGASVEYRFRNGKSVHFTAREIRVEKLLDDVKAYIKSRPKRLEWNKTNVENIGYRLIREDQQSLEQEKYLGREVASWDLELKSRPNHFDKRVTVATPLTKAGAYLLTAKMADGNESLIVLWLNDTAIVRKAVQGQSFYFVADAATGRPIEKANLEFFGYRMQHRRPNQVDIEIEQFAEHTDKDGQALLGPRDQKQDFQWLVTARTEDGRFGFLGPHHVWFSRDRDSDYGVRKAFGMTDRPVYRPKQKVHYKFWVRDARYEMPVESYHAGRPFTLEIFNPKGEKVETKDVTADAYGGFEGELELPEDATLGVWRVNVLNLHSDLHFRVEEYKKPEFEVSVDAPSEPVMLGEKITATVKAKYYFGSPVTDAKVKYTVTRTTRTERWYPICRWDWLYGRGYGWLGYDYVWYPGWWDWGCPRPHPIWWRGSHMPPEIVAQNEVPIGADGTVKIDIDTAVAKAIHPDQDHQYSITAEVVDQSRRTIVGSGSVLVARKPFKVYAWLDRGYCRVGETIEAHFSAQTLDNKPVQGRGKLTLLKISYKDAKPVETAVQTWDLAADAQGEARKQFTASQAGQYRLAYQVTDAQERTIEGGQLFTVIGSGFDGSDFRFNKIELVPDRREYAPGETVQLQVNTDRIGSTVLLFVRPSNSVYPPPQTLRLEGKSTLVKIGVAQKDMPNFFIEAITIADGLVHEETREIVVPPEKRILNVEIKPSSETYRPGQKAKVQVRLTDLQGKPFVGSTVVAIYDKSVEYISGGSNVPEIKAFFWKWRRNHYPRTESSLTRGSGNMVRPNTPAMGNLGVFGETAVEEVSEGDANDAALSMDGAEGMGAGGMGGMGMGGMRAERSMAMPKPASPMALAARPMSEFKSKGTAGAFGAAMADKAEAAGSDAPMVEPTVRTNFADTALWAGDLTTGQDGTAEVELAMPESLTTWRIKVWGMGQGTRVGEGQTEVITRKDLILRLQAPRFFVQGDEVVLSANVHNYLKTKKKVEVKLELDGAILRPIDKSAIVVPKVSKDDLAKGLMEHVARGKDLSSPPEMARGTVVVPDSVEIAPNGEARVDWRVKVVGEGEAVVRMKALTDEESDAMEMKFPSYVHGMLKTESYSGVVRPKEDSGKITVNVPKDRRPEQSRLEIRYSPTLAGAMVDALPYLVEYPYGCTEQTLNRFLPTVVTQRILLRQGVDLKAVREKRTNLNAQEIGDDQARAKQWKRFDRNPVFDADEVARMVKSGVKRLTEMQLSDGGWGWFSGWGEHSSAHTTAVVVHGLQIAKENDVALVPGVLERGVGWLTRYQNEEVQKIRNAEKKPKKEPYKLWADDTDAFVYMVLTDAGVKNGPMREYLYRDRTHLSVYSLAMFGMALHKEGGQQDKLAMILRNIGQYVAQDEENQTAWLNLPEGNYWWCWHGSEYEAEAYYLKLLARTDPKGELAPRLVKYLLNNRKHATYWNSTRDTALCLEAFGDFLRASGEDRPEMTVQILIDGNLEKAVEITSGNLFTFDNKVVLEGDKLIDGKHEVEIKRTGRGPVYFNAYMTNFTTEDFITRAGLEVKVNRKYYRLKAVDKKIDDVGSHGQVVDRKIEKFTREELPNLAAVASGDLVEIELEIDSKNDYEYLLFEDMKPAGFEPVEVRSGYNGNPLGAYVEFRDNRVVFFVRQLARGKHSVSYRMRAETPGRFSALPARASAMYAPELKGNSDEIKLRVEDKEEKGAQGKEPVEKNGEKKADLPEKQAVAVAKGFMQQHRSKDAYKLAEPSRVEEHPTHWYVYFGKKRNVPPNEGIVLVNKQTGEAEWRGMK